jgi:hypothetical protein
MGVRARMTAATRYCRGCGPRRSPDEFAFKSVLKKTRHSRCRVCCREASRRYYGRRKGAYLERNRRNKPLRRENGARFVCEFLAEHPCAGCGEADPIGLEFDHRDPAEKSANISDLIRNFASVGRREVRRALRELSPPADRCGTGLVSGASRRSRSFRARSPTTFEPRSSSCAPTRLPLTTSG